MSRRFPEDCPVTFYVLWWSELDLVKVGICWNEDRLVELGHAIAGVYPVVIHDDRQVPRWWEKGALKTMHEHFRPAFRSWRECHDAGFIGGRGYTEFFHAPGISSPWDLWLLIENGLDAYAAFRERWAAGAAALLRRDEHLADEPAARAPVDPPRADAAGEPGWDGPGSAEPCEGESVAPVGDAAGHGRGAPAAPCRARRRHPVLGGRIRAILAPSATPLHSRYQRQWGGGRKEGAGAGGRSSPGALRAAPARLTHPADGSRARLPAAVLRTAPRRVHRGMRTLRGSPQAAHLRPRRCSQSVTSDGPRRGGPR